MEACASFSRPWASAPSARSRRRVRQALADGRLKGNEKLPTSATITIAALGFTHEVKGTIELE